MNGQGNTNQADVNTDHIHVFQAVNNTEASDQSEADFYHTNMIKIPRKESYNEVDEPDDLEDSIKEVRNLLEMKKN